MSTVDTVRSCPTASIVDAGPITSTVILGTAQVRIRINESVITAPVRGLCDTGSQINLVTENCIQLYGMRKTKQCTPIAGIGSTSYASGYVDVHLVHRFNDDISTPARLLVVSRISSPLPDHRVQSLIQNETVVGDLADSMYNIPGTVDILIGAGTWAAIVASQVVRESNGNRVIMAQHTMFG